MQSVLAERQEIEIADKKPYAKLRGRIVEKFGTISAFGRCLDISPVQLSKKLSGKAGFSQSDIIRWCKLLDIDLRDVGEYFFDIEV